MSRFEPKRRYPITDLNGRVGRNGYVAMCEAAYGRRLRNVAKEILDSGRKVVLLAGPTSSGKTTSTHRLAGTLEEMGTRATVVSLDNFYLDGKDYPKLPDGTDDYESLWALDVERINRCLGELVTEGKSWLPSFDFKTRTRTLKAEHMELGEHETLLIEGIHGLNPELTRTLQPGSVFKVYAGLRTEYYEGEERIIQTQDIRLIRRMIRDVRERNHDAEATMLKWPSIRDGEIKWIRPFRKEADTLLNTSLDYEPCLYAPILEEMVKRGSGKSRQAELEALAARFATVEGIGSGIVPASSMLREFIGGIN